MRHVCMSSVLVVLVTLCGVCLCGCGGDGNGGGGGDVVPLGANHIYAAGDHWAYRLTGTYRPAGAASISFGPVVANLDYDATIVPLQAAVDTTLLKVSGDVSVGTHHDEEFRNAIAFTQDRSGVLTVYGYTPHLSGDLPVERMDPPFTGLSFSDLPGGGDLSHSGTLGIYGDFAATTHFVANETVTVPAGTFETSRLTASATLDGFTVDFTLWVNPQLGAPVRAEVHWEEYDGSTMDLTVVLTATTVAYD
jgi:hypothetical protein